MKFILGQKKNMTQLFTEDGTVIPVTVVEATQNVITQVKTRKKDGYYAVQVGSGVTKKRHTKPQQGHLKDLNLSRWMREFRFDANRDAKEEIIEKQLEKFSRGMTFGVEIFRPGDSVSVQGTSKGRGFQGVVKRHGFSGAPKTHGTKDQVRMPGSIGATGPAHVFKGLRMGGRMGTDLITVQGLQIVKVDYDNNLLYVKGALPGAINSLVLVSGPGTFKMRKVVADETVEKTSEDTTKDIAEEEQSAEEVAVEEKTEEVQDQTQADTQTSDKKEETETNSVEEKTEEKEEASAEPAKEESAEEDKSN